MPSILLFGWPSAPFRLASRLAVLLLIGGFCAGAAVAQPSTDMLWGFQGNGSLQSLTATPDIDGDGGADIVFEGYENGPTGANHVFAIRGRSSGTGEVLWSARPIGGVSSGGGWGDNCIRLGPDLNGDAFPDILLGTAWGGRTAFALNGRTGSTLWGFDTYAHYGSSYAGWIYAMDSLGSDLTGDGVPEIVFASGSYNDRLHCVNGATGALLWVYYGGDAFMDVRSCQDLNDDGVRDLVASFGDDAVTPRLIALSGTNGSVLWQRNIGNAVWNLTFITDLNADGVKEVVAASWAAQLTCVNGKTGAVLWNPAIGAQQRVATLDDVNGDGIEDVVVGLNTGSTCKVVSGANGSLLWSRATNGYDWAVDRVADCTGDGINDVCAGDFSGRVWLFDGVTGAVVWQWMNPTGDKIMTIRGVPDLDGNGAPDVVCGTQLLYNGTGGSVYALQGNTNVTSAPGGPVATRLFVGEAFPNPSHGRAEWSLTAREPGTARLQLFAPDGRLVRETGTTELPAGSNARLAWDGRDASGKAVPAGVYRARVLYNGRPEAQRTLVVLR